MAATEAGTEAESTTPSAAVGSQSLLEETVVAGTGEVEEDKKEEAEMVEVADLEDKVCTLWGPHWLKNLRR